MQDLSDYEIIFEIIKCIRSECLNIKEFVEFLKLFIKNPNDIRRIIEESASRNIIKRQGSKILILKKSRNKSKIIRERCKDYCRRCGRSIRNCFYISVYNITFGPYGSECVKKFLNIAGYS